jgi:hypothetical protein
MRLPAGSHGPVDGWLIFADAAAGNIEYQLEMHHENYDNDFHLPDDCNLERGGAGCYLSPASGDTLHIFQAFQLPLPPGKYTVEVAILSYGNLRGGYGPSCFPFVITRKQVVDVRLDHETQLDVGVPDDWSESYSPPAVSATRVCSEKESPPDNIQLQRWLEDYAHDPMVRALGGADATSKGVVVLDLPLDYGGKREFDGPQIRHITDAILRCHNLPDHSEIEECRTRFPLLAPAYDAYEKAINSIVNKDIQRFRELAASLERGQ